VAREDQTAFDLQVENVVRAAARLAALAAPEVAAIEPALADEIPPAGGRDHTLARLLGIEADDIDLLWTVVARAVEPRVSAHLRAAFGGEAKSGVSLAHHIALRELAADRARRLLHILDPRHPLRSHGIVIPIDEAVDVTTRWTVPPRVWNYLRGDDELDGTIARLGGIVTAPPALRISLEQSGVVDTLRDWLLGEQPATIVVDGAAASGRRVAVALAADRLVVTADFSRVAPRRAEAVLLALRREALLLDALPVLANLDDLWSKLPPGDDIMLALSAALDETPGPVVITTMRTDASGIDVGCRSRTVLRARWPLPDVDTRRALWSDRLDEDGIADALTEHELDQIAVRYQLGAGGIEQAARSAQQRASQRGAPRPGFSDVAAGVQDNIAEQLGELTRRIEVRQQWSELVMSSDSIDDIKSLLGRIRHAHFVLDRWGFRRKLARGSGVAALFSGPPGTGKTMVAGLIARELQLELYQVDLSRIVSKWVGETEKQLARVFEAAEAGHALLLFDEADALFAKRSVEVKSAVDRYANLEVNYLLQRVESFGGVVVLTTNLDTSIDPALRRRLASHIRFGTPEAEERIRMWSEMLNTGAPVEEDIDLRELAEEFDDMTGANIRNAVLSAAFLAADEGVSIRQDHLLRAARGEYRAMGHVLAKDHSRRGRA
jgi:hypothetical protein